MAHKRRQRTVVGTVLATAPAPAPKSEAGQFVDGAQRVTQELLLSAWGLVDCLRGQREAPILPGRAGRLRYRRLTELYYRAARRCRALELRYMAQQRARWAK